MTWRQRGFVAGVAVVVLAASFISGRYSRPARIEVTTKTVTETKVQTQYVDRWHDRIVYRQAAARHVETRTDKLPTGEVVITRVEDSHTDTHADEASGGQAQGSSASDTHSTTETKTVTIYERPRLRLAYMPGLDLRKRFDLAQPFAALTHGLEVDYRFLGPLQVGAWGRTDRTLGLSLAVEF